MGIVNVLKIIYWRWSDFLYKRQLKRQALTGIDIEKLVKENENFSYKPLISVIMTVYNIEREWLVRAIESVLAQVYGNWELCIVDDASTREYIKVTLEEYEGKDKRIKVRYLEKNLGMSGAANEALMMAAGEYTAFMDHDDELSNMSLFEVVKLLNREPGAGLIFTDEDKLTLTGERIRPVYKKGWDPDLFLTYNYLCHLVVCRRDLVMAVGGFRKGFEGSQDYDLWLRITEKTNSIFHIPKILYHWRMVPGSAAFVVNAKQDAFEKSKQALREGMKRRGIDADVIDGKRIGTFKIVPK
jgi:glycosyltransferase involved in cell wall biosynthesis